MVTKGSITTLSAILASGWTKASGWFIGVGVFGSENYCFLAI
jgi:hypothetical protein